ncbi:MAG: hypothetical protein A2Z50_06995 [Nitrospirae bacterium RBG_19FT_COMBO_42_15]|nr:MAG: hypothetical protein A2Z50_06995 [Nitrospirae bacterium RBG_19FT_COMBO_42_15]
MIKKNIILLISILFFFPSLTFAETISLNLKYTPSPSLAAGSDNKINIGFSGIIDSRQRENKFLVGERINYSGAKDFLAPAGISVEDAVAAMISEYFKKKGFQWKKVEKWNLSPDAIKEDWGDIVVGGEILELWNDVTSKVMNNNHKVKAKLKIVVANAKEKRILWTDTATTSLEMKEPLFHEESAEKIINEAASSCIENIFEDKAFKEIIGIK